MNKTFRSLWNASKQAWVAAAETVSARGKPTSGVKVAAVLAGLVGSLLGTLAHAQTAPPPTALPTGGQVSAGNASISASGANMVINQSSNRAAINWQSFNVGSNAQVQFNQPSASSVTLNRVMSSDPSQIFGRITANGQVVLSNPAGVYFGKDARVDVGGLVATTHGMSDADFMAGKSRYERNGSTASVVNEGELKAALGGYIALLAPEVRNQGAIIAQMGTVALASGEAIDLKFDSNNRLTSLRVEPSQIAALVENKHAVQAPGGLVIISAQSMDRLVGGVVRNSGRIEANGLQRQGGRIVLSASTRVDNSGSVSANATTEGPAGKVEISAPEVVNSGSISATGAGQHSAGSVLLQATHFTQADSGSIDLSAPHQGGQLSIQTTGNVSLQGSVNVQATQDRTAAGEPTQGGQIDIAAQGDIELNNATLDASGGQGGRIALRAKAPSQPDNPNPLPDAPGQGRLAIMGNSTLSTRGRSSQGGSSTLLGEHIELLDTTAIDATGVTGGGSVLVGGDWQGGNGVYQATTVTMTEGVTIDASATTQGNGGTVVLWSDLHNANSQTRAQGSVLAQGGALGGNGGQVETSGQVIDIDGFRVNTLAPQGQTGLWLIDPYNYTIGSTQAATISANLNTSDVTITTASNVTAYGSSGNSGDAGDIYVNSAITKDSGSATTLTLKADRHIRLRTDGSISSTGGALNVQLWADTDKSGDGIIYFESSGITTNGGSLTFGSSGQKASLGGQTVLVGGDVFFQRGSVQTLSTNGGAINIYGEAIVANTSGLTINSGNGNITFHGLLNSGNQYTFVDKTADTNHNWDWARTDARNSTAGGSATGDSYLVNITSRLENAIAGLTANYAGAWIGAYRSDTSNHNWVWADGPEANKLFFTQNASGGGGTTAAGFYSNFGSGEPNGTLSTTRTSVESVGQFFGSSGLWNDLNYTTTFSSSQSSQYAVLGYIRETNLATSPVTIQAGTGAVTFSSAVGSSKALASLTVNGGVANINGGTVSTQGTQTYNAPVVLGAHTTLTTQQSDITFNSTVNSAENTNWNLTTNITPSTNYYWVDWTSATATTVTGQIVIGGETINVTYSSSNGFQFAQTSGGTNYWTGYLGGSFSGASPYVSAQVANGPTGSDIIALRYAGSQTLTFSKAVENLAFSVVSMNGNGYAFNQNFDIVSYTGFNGAGPGYYGGGTFTKTQVGSTYQLNDGGTNSSSQNGNSEPHGTIRFNKSFSELTWQSLSNEVWNGFTVGITGTSDNAGAVRFNGVVGGSRALGDLSINAQMVSSSTSAITAASLAVTGRATLGNNITTTGNQSFSSAVTLSRDVQLKTTVNGNVSTTSDTATINGAQALTIQTQGSGTVSLAGAVGGIAALTQVSLNTSALSGTGGIALASGGSLSVTQSGNSVYDGTISGTDATLIKAGAGQLTLSANNTYGGVTTISEGEIRLGNGGTTGSLGSGAVTNNGSLAFNRSNDVTFTQVISGTGSVSKLLSASLTLTGDNTYSGTTTIAAGTLQIGNGGTTGSLGGGAITNNGTLVFNRSDPVTFSQAIGGSGALSKLAGNTVTLTGSNSYSGTTTISAGTLQVGDGGSTGTLGTGSVTNNAVLVFNRSSNLTVDNLISGSGSLTQMGSGVLTLTANNTYSGANTLSGGVLVLSNNAPNPTSKTFNGTGQLRIEPTADNFSSAFSTSGWTLGSSLSSLTLGKSGNIADVTVASVTSIAGPISIYAGNINLNAHLTSTADSAAILLKASGSIIQASSIAVTSKGGAITYWSDSDSTNGGYVWFKSGSSVSTGNAAGNITVSGGNVTDLATGFAMGSTSVMGNGVTLDGVTLSSYGGNILIRGKSATSSTTYASTDAASTGNANGIRAHGSVSINSGTGTLSLWGYAQSTTGSSNGIELSASGTSTYQSAATSGTAITLEGTTTTAPSDAWGVYLWGTSTLLASGGGGISITGSGFKQSGVVVPSGSAVLASGGTITLTGTGYGSSSFNAVDVAGHVGQKSGTLASSAANIVITGDKLSLTGNLSSSGQFTLQPYTDSFASAFSTSGLNLGGAFTGLTIGKSSNTTAITIGSATTVAGPITLYGGAIAINGAMTASNGAATPTLYNINLHASGAVTQTAAITAAGLGLQGTGSFTLTNTGNRIGTLAGGSSTTRLGSLSLTNAGALSIGSVNPTGIWSTGDVAINTGSGLLTLTENISALGSVSLTGLGVSGSGNINLASSQSLTITQSGASTYEGVISGDASFTKLGAGTLTLSGANSYTGNTTISAGVLQLGSAGTSSSGPLGTTAGGTTVASGAALDLGGYSLAATEAFTISGTGVSGSGAIFNSSGTAVTLASPITLAANASIQGGSAGLTLSGATTGAYTLDVSGSSSITLGSVDIAALNVSSSGALSLGATTLSGALSANSGNGNITQTGALAIGGTSSLSAGSGSITLNHTSNSFTGAVAVLAGTTDLTATGDLTVALTTSGTSTLQAGGHLMVSGTVTGASSDLRLDAGTKTTFGTTTVDGNFVSTTRGAGTAGGVGQTEAGVLTVKGHAQFTADTGALQNAALGNDNDFRGTVSFDETSQGSWNNLTLKDVTGGITLGGLNPMGALTVTSTGGAITQAANTSIEVGGASSLTAHSGSIPYDITLAGTRNDFQGPVNASGNNITLVDRNNLMLANVTATGNLDVTAAMDLTLSGTVNAGTLDLNASSGSIQQIGGTLTVVTGPTRLTAGGDISLTQANDFTGTVDASGNNITLNDVNTLTAVLNAGVSSTLSAGGNLAVSGNTDQLSTTTTQGGTTSFGATTVTGNLNAISSGSIVQTSALTVGGDTTLRSGGDISLAQANDFTGTVNASGNNITLNDVNTLTAVLNGTGSSTLSAGGNLAVSGSMGSLGTSTSNDGTTSFGATTVTGNLNANSSGNITQTGALNVGGSSTLLTPGDIVLNHPFNDFKGAVNASANNVDLRDANALTLGTVNARGDVLLASTGPLNLGASTIGGKLSANSGGGNITQSGPLRLQGYAELLAGAGTVILTDPGNSLPKGSTVQAAAYAITGDARQAALAAASNVLGSLPATPANAGLPRSAAPPPLLQAASGVVASGKNSSASSDSVAAGGGNNAGITIDLRSAPVGTAAIMAAVSLPPGSSTTGTGFAFELPQSVRELRTDGAQAQASLPDGSTLPSWLKFDGQNLRFEATAVPSGAFPLQVALTVSGQRVMVVISERTE